MALYQVVATFHDGRTFRSSKTRMLKRAKRKLREMEMVKTFRKGSVKIVELEAENG